LGVGAWNENRTYSYNSRNQLKAQTLGLSSGSSTTLSYGFDSAKLGVRTTENLSGDLANSWNAAPGSPDGFGRVLRESINQSSISFQANGCAVGAAEVHGTIDGNPLTNISYNPLRTDGRWSADLNLTPTNHTLSMSASARLGNFTNTSSSTFA